MRKNCQRRAGFTLIELLVVMAIIGILASLAVAFVPRAQEQERSAGAASQLQGWLAVAKQWALRDKAPRGVRLLAGSTNAQYVTQLEYIEQPDDFFGGTVTVTFTSGTTYKATATGVDFTGGFTTASSQPVQTGDLLEVSGASQLFSITSVSSTSLGLTGPSLPSGVTVKLGPTADYRIVRQARPRVGEAPLELPANVVIDLTTNQTYGNTLSSSTPPIDIMFSPAGPLVGWTGTGDMIQLWLRDTSNDSASGSNVLNGEPILVTVYVRTGMIAANPVDTTAGNSNPYGVTQTGGPSGL